jgi:hypothetical protein
MHRRRPSGKARTDCIVHVASPGLHRNLVDSALLPPRLLTSRAQRRSQPLPCCNVCLHAVLRLAGAHGTCHECSAAQPTRRRSAAGQHWRRCADLRLARIVLCRCEQSWRGRHLGDTFFRRR